MRRAPARGANPDPDPDQDPGASDNMDGTPPQPPTPPNPPTPRSPLIAARAAAAFDWLLYFKEERPATVVNIPRPAVGIASALFANTLDAAVQARGTPDELGANVAILLFARAILAPLPPGMHGYSAAAEYRRRRDAWLAGELEPLLRRPAAPRPRGPTVPREDRKYHRAAAFASEGLFRKARQALQSFGSPPADQFTVQKLMDLHPARKFPAPIEPPAAPPLPLGHSELEKIFLNMPRHSSTHRDGWRWEHLRALCEDNVAVARSFITWLQLLLAGQLPARILDYLRSSTLLAFNKLSLEEQAMLASWERKIRPIAVGSVLIRAALSLEIGRAHV